MLHGQPHGRLVVARVVHPAGLGRVRELLGLDEVLQPQLGRVHVQLVGQAVDDPLDQVDRLGDPERAGVRDAARRLVGVDRGHLAVRGLDVVAAGEDAEEAGRVLHRRGGAVERAVVGEHVGADGQDLAVAGRRDLAAHDVVAGEAGADQVLRAVLHPLHRLAGDDASRRSRRRSRGRSAPCCRSRRRCPARSPGSCARAGRPRSRRGCGGRAAPGWSTTACSLPSTGS